MTETQAPLEGGVIEVRVADGAGTLLSGALVEVAEARGRDRRIGRTESGVRLFRYLPAGSYRVEVSKNGFRSAKVQGVEVTGAGTRVVALALEPAPPPRTPGRAAVPLVG